ncbi:MAG TPA: c-type cytochrome domain-containing protein, partial [Pirellulaceae bacterium]|nr:c-type cytochrome domain-containing protein [Pirellulaceae bacterium]
MNVRILIALSLMVLPVLNAQAQEKPAADQPKITYDDHVRPILREHCLTCHNPDMAKGGLVLDSYAKTMAGGSGGEVVLAGDVDSSRLYALVAHLEQPYMPPKQDQLATAKLDLIKKWIEQGALENSGSKAIIKKKKTFEFSGGGAGKPAGPVAMPEGVWRQPVVYTPRASAVTAIATSPWAPLAAVAGQRQIVLYNTDSAQCLGVLPFPEGMPYVLKFSANGSLLLAGGGRGGHSGFVALYDVKTGKRIAKVGDELDAVLAADINPSHTLVALGGPNRVVRIYSTDSGELLHEIRKHTDWIYGIAFSPDGVLLATSDRSGGLFVWESETAREYAGMRGHNGAVNGVAWRDDSNVLASAGDDGTIKLWEMNEGNQIKTWNAHGGGALAVAFAHDGKIASVGNDKLTKTWDGNGGALKSFPASTEATLRVAFTHDGARVVAGDWNGDVRLFDANEAKQVAVLAPNPPTLAMLIDAQTASLAPLTAAAAQQVSELAV